MRLQLFAAVNDHNLQRVIELLEEHAEPLSSSAVRCTLSLFSPVMLALPQESQEHAMNLNYQEPTMGESWFGAHYH